MSLATQRRHQWLEIATIEAVRKFIEPSIKRYRPLARPFPAAGDRRLRDGDGDRLVHTKYDFIRKVIDSAGKSLHRSGDTK